MANRSQATASQCQASATLLRLAGSPCEHGAECGGGAHCCAAHGRVHWPLPASPPREITCWKRYATTIHVRPKSERASDTRSRGLGTSPGPMRGLQMQHGCQGDSPSGASSICMRPLAMQPSQVPQPFIDCCVERLVSGGARAEPRESRPRHHEASALGIKQPLNTRKGRTGRNDRPEALRRDRPHEFSLNLHPTGNMLCLRALHLLDCPNVAWRRVVEGCGIHCGWRTTCLP